MEKPKEPSKSESAQTSLPSDIDGETEAVIDEVIAEAQKLQAAKNKKQQLN